MAVHVVCGVNLEGKREVLAVEPMYEESEASYTALFTGLKKRGLKTYGLRFPMPIKAWSLPLRNPLSGAVGNGARFIL